MILGSEYMNSATMISMSMGETGSKIDYETPWLQSDLNLHQVQAGEGSCMTQKSGDSNQEGIPKPTTMCA